MGKSVLVCLLDSVLRVAGLIEPWHRAVDDYVA